MHLRCNAELCMQSKAKQSNVLAFRVKGDTPSYKPFHRALYATQRQICGFTNRKKEKLCNVRINRIFIYMYVRTKICFMRTNKDKIIIYLK